MNKIFFLGTWIQSYKIITHVLFEKKLLEFLSIQAVKKKSPSQVQTCFNYSNSFQNFWLKSVSFQKIKKSHYTGCPNFKGPNFGMW